MERKKPHQKAENVKKPQPPPLPISPIRKKKKAFSAIMCYFACFSKHVKWKQSPP